LREFLDWLEVEARGFAIISLMFKMLIVDLAWNFFAMTVLLGFGSTFSFYGQLAFPLPESLDMNFSIFLFSAALIEEWIFRFLPLLIVVRIFGKSPIVFVTMIISSVIFGACHGGPINIMFQGVSGFFFCIVFLKCGGFQSRPLKALLSSTTSHFLFNLVIFAIGMMARGV